MKFTIDDRPAAATAVTKTPTIRKLEAFLVRMPDGKLLTSPQLSAQTQTPLETVANMANRIDPELSVVHKRRLYGNKKTIQAYREQFEV